MTEEACSTDDGYIHAANDFHYVLASMTGNKVFDLVATALKELYTSRLVGGGMAGRTFGPEIRLEHAKIGQSILAGDAVKAERLMRKHVQRYQGRIREQLPTFAHSKIVWE